MDIGDDVIVPIQSFEDGTIRRSFATSTLPDKDGGPQPIKTLEEYEALLSSGQQPKSKSCQRFRDHLSAFRSAVDLATMRFAERLSAEMGASLSKPILMTHSSNNNNNSADYESIKGVVAAGKHLEHFHSYQKRGVGSSSSEEATIDLHTDQGFFIAFTPGLVVSQQGFIELSNGFYVQDSNGEKRLMEFTEDDDLVFMLGDGVNQFINNKIIDMATKDFVQPRML